MLYEIDGKDFVIMAKSKQDGTQEVAMASLTPDHLDQLQFDEITSFKEDAVLRSPQRKEKPLVCFGKWA